ncbi:Tagatose-6-phosphate kinase / 1-phosphofructokinase [Methylophaga lonarensis MPL]|uniref:Phosphofructokinase n=1 Tax=Methylophaga lonarensis MPL TaxID=1286106 RepID=M7NXA0_9GAMM|nr:1-phosphofructokinase family hexose kinase [Methylophaga lonarensis]EMR13413.1 Tagatose-6-phosphate kinase / 1-phosphofructokinase [Methylophaga lonarensis MPL]
MTSEAAKITSLCLNPALDVTYHVNRLIPEQKSRSDAARHDPGGNGINVGRALQRMKFESTTFCVIAGAVGEILKQMLQQQLNNVTYHQVDGETRINSTVIETESHNQFQIVDAGTPISPRQLESVTEDFLQQTGQGFGILTGSLQPDVPTSLYAQLVENIHAQGGKAVVDSHGVVLKSAIAARPFLIKPNKYELETLLNVRLNTREAIAHSARQIQNHGVQYVCVSLGAEGAIIVGPDNSYHAKALKVPVNTTVGAGDSMVAGLVAGFSLDGQAQTALRYGIACGAGTVMHPGTELFSGHELADFRDRVKIKTLDI